MADRASGARARAGATLAAAAAIWLAAGAAPQPPSAQQPPSAPRLLWPLDCRIGVDCVVQQYPDLDPGPGVRDPGCGRRAYDGHEGVDIRVRSLSDLRRGVVVRAAADGRVLRVRDRARLRRGEHCGVGVVIAHAGGLETQYCHLAPGRVVARAGQFVRAGDPIGRIGMTGRTSFPHLHLTVRRGGAPVDPFTGAGVGDSCRGGAGGSLWRDPGLAYEPAAFLDAGFSDRAPTPALLARGGERPRAAGADALVFWARALGVARGDRFEVSLRGPDGALLARHAEQLSADQAVRFLYAGLKAPALGFAPGRYTGRARLIRDGAPVLDRRWTMSAQGPWPSSAATAPVRALSVSMR